jgi:Tfp pilus assembly protein PilV
MTDLTLRPPKKRSVFNPVLIELTIVILFFALSTSVIVQLISAANTTARESEYHARAILAMESVAEQIKADPAAQGTPDENGMRSFMVNVASDLAVNCVVTGDQTPAQGTLYSIALSVVSPKGKVYSLDAVRYIADAEAAP